MVRTRHIAGAAVVGALAVAAPAQAAVQGQIAGTERTFTGPNKCKVTVALSSPSAGNIQGWMLLNSCGGSAILSIQQNGQNVQAIGGITAASWATNTFSKGATGTHWRACVIANASGCSGEFIK